MRDKPDWTPRFRRRIPIAVQLKGPEAVRVWLAAQKGKR